jgi:hypothetical protein
MVLHAGHAVSGGTGLILAVFAGVFLQTAFAVLLWPARAEAREPSHAIRRRASRR